MKKEIAPPFGLRMPQDMKDWVSAQAEKEDRSMNWVLVKIIESAMKKEDSK